MDRFGGTTEPVVRLQNAHLAFGQRVILDAIDLEVAPGEAIALLGPSGVGKTSLLRVLSGAQPLNAGSVEVLGKDPHALSGAALRSLLLGIGHLYQNDALVPGLRCLHNVLVGRLGRWSLLRSLISLIWPQDIELARAALAKVGLADRMSAPIANLSGGERQRVALARLLIQEPKLILADEPVAALDPRLAREMIELLVGLAKTEGRCCIVTLHDIDMVGPYFDRVLALKDGRWFFDGRPGDLDDTALGPLYIDDRQGATSGE